jgi:hypothetical protein
MHALDEAHVGPGTHDFAQHHVNEVGVTHAADSPDAPGHHGGVVVSPPGRRAEGFTRAPAPDADGHVGHHHKHQQLRHVAVQKTVQILAHARQAVNNRIQHLRRAFRGFPAFFSSS